MVKINVPKSPSPSPSVKATADIFTKTPSPTTIDMSEVRPKGPSISSPTVGISPPSLKAPPLSTPSVITSGVQVKPSPTPSPSNTPSVKALTTPSPSPTLKQDISMSSKVTPSEETLKEDNVVVPEVEKVRDTNRHILVPEGKLCEGCSYLETGSLPIIPASCKGFDVVLAQGSEGTMKFMLCNLTTFTAE